MTPREFLLARRPLQIIIAEARKMIDQYEEDAHESSLPSNLRPAVPGDIVEGALIWYKHGDNGHFWQIVEEVLRPNDPWKAYSAEDGCRYGLDDAWVELR